MKKIVSLLLCCCVLFLAACDSGSGNQNISEESTESTETTEAVALTAEEQYAEFLHKLCDRIRKIIGDDTYLDGFTQDEGMVGVYEIVQLLNRDMLNMMGYQITDINGDGISELLICEVDALNTESCVGTRILCAYTFCENEKVLLLDGYTRNSFFLLDDATLYNKGSSGAAYVSMGIYQLENESDKLSCVDFYFTDADENGNPLFFHNQTGEWDQSASEPFNGDENAFWALSADMESRIQSIELTPLSAFEG